MVQLNLTVDEFINHAYVTNAQGADVITRLLQIIDEKESGLEFEFRELFCNDTPQDVFRQLDNALSDLRSMEDEYAEQAREITRLSNRTIADMLQEQADKIESQEAKIRTLANDNIKLHTRAVDAEQKLGVWDILKD